MIVQKGKALNAAFLVFFFLVISFANFFHTERTPFENDGCPACNLVKSTQATSQIHFFLLAEPVLLETLAIIKSFHYSHIGVEEGSSRSPPQVG
ncbi:MAG: hypothetical protein WBC70_17530 [Candidatus Aminicenantales bacterium]